MQGLLAGPWLPLQAQSSSGAAAEQDFGERPTVHVVAGRAVIFPGVALDDCPNFDPDRACVDLAWRARPSAEASRTIRHAMPELPQPDPGPRDGLRILSRPNRASTGLVLLWRAEKRE